MIKKNPKILYYTLAMNIRNQPVVVIGGGKVAEYKVTKLMPSCPNIIIISPDVTVGLRRLVSQGKLTWRSRNVRKTDLKNAFIAIAATSDKDVNAAVSRWAKEYRVLINVVDNPKLSDFISPATFHLSKTTVAVHTNGDDPVLSRDLKNFLKRNWDAFLSFRNRL